MRSKIIGGAPSSIRMPTHPPNLKVLPAAHVLCSETSGTREYGWEESQGPPDRHWLEASRRVVSWSSSVGSLLLTEAVSLNAEQIRRGVRLGGENEYAGKVGGGGPGSFSREDIMRGSGGSDFESCGGGGASKLVLRRR